MSGPGAKRGNGGAPSTVTTVSAHDATQKADLASNFECPVCFEYALPPIYQCAAGHLLCSECRPKITRCPSCRGRIGNIRNLALENIAQTVSFPCKYACNGCATLVLHSEKAEHEESCEFRPYTCPIPGDNCKWTGSLDHVMPHLMSCHKNIDISRHGRGFVFLATDINNDGFADWVEIQSCFDQHFILVLRKQELGPAPHFYFGVELIGPKKQSEKYDYRLKLSWGRENLVREGTTGSIRDGICTAATQQSECLSFNNATAQRFAVNGNLAIEVDISMAISDPCEPGTAG